MGGSSEKGAVSEFGQERRRDVTGQVLSPLRGFDGDVAEFVNGAIKGEAALRGDTGGILGPLRLDRANGYDFLPFPFDGDENRLRQPEFGIREIDRSSFRNHCETSHDLFVVQLALHIDRFIALHAMNVTTRRGAAAKLFWRSRLLHFYCTQS
jgi:hypothetical protein